MTVTDKDRAAALMLTCGKLARTLYAAEIAEAIAQAREEGRAELDAERAAHEATKERLRVDDWSATEPYRQEIAALKARLALAEAVCESCRQQDRGYGQQYDNSALAAWRAAK